MPDKQTNYLSHWNSLYYQYQNNDNSEALPEHSTRTLLVYEKIFIKISSLTTVC